jgi:hypothetical protein
VTRRAEGRCGNGLVNWNWRLTLLVGTPQGEVRGTWVYWTEELVRLPADGMPPWVTFGGISRPETLGKVDPGHLAALLGESGSE